MTSPTETSASEVLALCATDHTFLFRDKNEQFTHYESATILWRLF